MLKEKIGRELTAGLFLLLVALGLARLSVLALAVEPNVDEETGIAEAYDYSFGELLLSGPGAELNTSPLHYLVDKTWISAFANAHLHYNLDLFFRLLPILFFALSSGFAFLLALRLCQHFAFTGWPALCFASAAGIFFQTNFILIRGAALQDRPYALWIFLSTLQLFLLTRAPSRPSKSLAALGALLALTSFASLIQVFAAAFCRMRGRSSWKILLEATPASLIALWYWWQSRGMFADFTTAGEFAGDWLNGILFGFWGRGDSLFQFGGLSTEWRHYNQIGILLPFAALAFLARWKKNPERALALFVCLLLLLALPVTLVAWRVAHSIQPRYLFFLYPALGLAHFLSLLALAQGTRDSGRPKLATAVLVAWAMLILLYRLPNMAENFAESLRSPWRFPLYRAQCSEACPAELGAFRMQVKGGIDLTRIQEHCLLGMRSTPRLNEKLGPVMPSSKFQVR